MKPKTTLVHLCLMVTVLFLLNASVFAEEAAFLKNGKKTDITMTEPTQVCGITLEAGVYQVQHRMHGNQHLMYFTLLEGSRPECAVDVECDCDPDRDKWRRSEALYGVEGGKKKLKKITIRGERVAYLFR